MEKHIRTIAGFLLLVLFPLQAAAFEWKTGDIVFQSYAGSQGFAIQLATGSVYNHCGVVVVKNGQPYIFEAVEPVKFTPLEEWAKRGNEGKYVVKRIMGADSLINEEVKQKMLAWAEKQNGKHYDIYFEWGDEKLYCSEVVWKIYRECAGIELGKLKALKEYKLDNPVVQLKLKERYGKSIPYDQKMIAPSDIFSSFLLTTVFSN